MNCGATRFRPYCILVAGAEGGDELVADAQAARAPRSGALSPCLQRSISSISLPKTRSGKIMRRVLKAQAQGLPLGDLSTLED